VPVDAAEDNTGQPTAGTPTETALWTARPAPPGHDGRAAADGAEGRPSSDVGSQPGAAWLRAVTSERLLRGVRRNSAIRNERRHPYLEAHHTRRLSDGGPGVRAGLEIEYASDTYGGPTELWFTISLTEDAEEVRAVPAVGLVTKMALSSIAAVSETGGLLKARAATASSQTGTGTYFVTFGSSISNRVYQATVDSAGGAPGFATTTEASSTVVSVSTFNGVAGAAVNLPFSLTVNC
jgi:hypothetical protein